jgi:methylenetetrahydrofolate dehydrogenase (NADP+)/methenyltetrahydrofolate cyclohydrolase
MSAQIIDGAKIAQDVYAGLAGRVETLRKHSVRPGLAAVLVGENAASRVYVKNKGAACKSLGLHSEVHEVPADSEEPRVVELLQHLNGAAHIHGILLQLPLPRHLNSERLLQAIAPAKDVDGFNWLNLGALVAGQPLLAPCTPLGVMTMLDRTAIAVEGKQAVVIGRSTIVGKPMAGLLLRENCTVTMAHSKSRDLAGICREADLLVAAVGRPGMITADHVREGAVVIDVGINRVQDIALATRLVGDDPKRLATLAEKGYALVGDVDFPAVAPRSSAITPVPGGVGPLTVAMLLANTLTSARRRFGIAQPAGGAQGGAH